MPSIKHVADAAGVSTATVSRVLAGMSVRPGVRERVMSAVSTLDYRPNRAARSLRSTKTTTLGLVVADIGNTFFTEIARAVEDTASRAGYSVFLCNSDEDAAKENAYLRLLRDENVAGAIVAPTRTTIRQLGDAPFQGLPTVMIDRGVCRPGIDAVVIDNVAAAETLTAELLAGGRRRVAGLFGRDTTTGDDRYVGFLNAHDKLDVRPVQELVRFVPPSEETGIETAAALLARDDRPDAFFVSNALLAIGVFQALTRSGLQCPQDTALACFDNAKWTGLVTPGLTVIEQPTYDMGRRATELLLARLADPARPSQCITLPHRLIVRGSTGG